MDIISPSRLVCDAMSLAPVGSEEASGDSHCGMCGGNIQLGDAVTPLKFPTSFTLYGKLFDQKAAYRCGYCAQICETNPFLLDLASGIYCKDGYYPIAKKANRGWGFTTPPEPPYVFAIQVNRSQHMLWRTPVGYSRDVITFRLGESVCNVRRPLLMKAVDTARRLQGVWLEQQSEARKKSDKKLPSPLGFSELKGSALGGGEIQSWVIRLIKNNIISESDLSPLTLLNNAEAWALDFMLVDIEQPCPITSLAQYKDQKSKK